MALKKNLSCQVQSFSSRVFHVHFRHLLLLGVWPVGPDGGWRRVPSDGGEVCDLSPTSYY